MINTILTTALATSLLFNTATPSSFLTAGQAGILVEKNQKVLLASESLDLSYRYPVESVSKGFKENILVNLYHFSQIGSDTPYEGIGSLEAQEKLPDTFSITLKPNEVFAFHDKILAQYKEDKVLAPKSKYGSRDGYLLISGLYGNGVCHLATLMNWVASETDLEVTALTRHDFAKIPGTDPKLGTSISYGNSPERQNLYIKNNKPSSVVLEFKIEGDNLFFSIYVQA
jgi:hypothetical protein